MRSADSELKSFLFICAQPDRTHNAAMATVLVVDDEPIVREVVVRYLEREGLRNTRGRRRHDGARVLEEQTADLVVLDVMLPGIDGLELCRWIRTPLGAPRDPADGPRRGGRSDRRTRSRRRRLRHETVLAPRARGAGADGVAPLCSHRSCISDASPSATSRSTRATREVRKAGVSSA